MRPAYHRSEEHTSELQSPCNLVCRLLLEKKKKNKKEKRNHEKCRGLRSQQEAAQPQGTPARLHALGRFLIPLAFCFLFFFFFFFNDTATTEIYPLSLHDALPI